MHLADHDCSILGSRSFLVRQRFDSYLARNQLQSRQHDANPMIVTALSMTSYFESSPYVNTIIWTISRRTPEIQAVVSLLILPLPNFRSKLGPKSQIQSYTTLAKIRQSRVSSRSGSVVSLNQLATPETPAQPRSSTYRADEVAR